MATAAGSLRERAMFTLLIRIINRTEVGSRGVSLVYSVSTRDIRPRGVHTRPIKHNSDLYARLLRPRCLNMFPPK